MSPLRLWLILPTLLLAVGCDLAPPSPSSPTKYDQTKAAGLTRLQAGAVEYSRAQLGYGEIIELRLPDGDIPHEPSFDKRCLLYRDHEFKTATLSCLPQDGFLPDDDSSIAP